MTVPYAGDQHRKYGPSVHTLFRQGKDTAEIAAIRGEPEHLVLRALTAVQRKPCGGLEGARMMGMATRLLSIAERRAPDVIIGGVDDPYMQRWWVIPRNRFFNIYLHHFMRSDDDRALHDHPWWNISFLLEGRYVEHTISAGGVNRKIVRYAGDWKFRRAGVAHRIELDDGPCWTLFITGPRLREWGFHCPRGWVHWRDFTNPADNGRTVGRGCGEDGAHP